MNAIYKHDRKAVEAAAEKVLAEKLEQGFVQMADTTFWPGTAYLYLATPEMETQVQEQRFVNISYVKRDVREEFVKWLRAGVDGEVIFNRSTCTLDVRINSHRELRRHRHTVRISDHISTNWRADGEIDAFYLIRENGEVVKTVA